MDARYSSPSTPQFPEDRLQPGGAAVDLWSLAQELQRQLGIDDHDEGLAPDGEAEAAPGVGVD